MPLPILLVGILLSCPRTSAGQIGRLLSGEDKIPVQSSHVDSLVDTKDWQGQERQYIIDQIRKWAAPDGHVVWTLANFGWLEFVLNWVAAVNLAGIDHFFVASLDSRLLLELKKRGVPCVSLNADLGSEDLEWGSEAFKARGLVKIKLIANMLASGLQPLFSDLDVVWLRNPLPYARSLQGINLLVSSDSCRPEGGVMLDDCPAMLRMSMGYATGGTYVGFMNVGIHLLRPSALPFVQAWQDEMIETGQMEQVCWNNVFNRTVQADGFPTSEPYCRAMNDTIRAGLFPAAVFQNGHTFFVQRTAQILGNSPYAVHASYVPGKAVKVHHFREALLWHVDPLERFGNSQRLLAIDLDLPAELLQHAGPPQGLNRTLELADAAGHMNLIQYQIAQIKAGAAVAKLLGRTLVMPQLWCGLENLWFGHRGRMWEGMAYPLPAPCNMGSLFHLDSWIQKAGQEAVLPPFVESSYFQNRRVRLKRGDMLHIKACEGAVDTARTCCSTPNQNCIPQREVMRIDTSMGREGIFHMFKAFQDTRVLKLSQVHRLWPTRAGDTPSLFDAAFAQVLRNFCCLAGDEQVAVHIPVFLEDKADNASIEITSRKTTSRVFSSKQF